jgi:hypothetical protein
MIDHHSIVLNNIYNAITKDIDIPPGQAYNAEGSMSIGDGLKIHIYSNDHGTHFHVKFQNAINARFSYPEITVERYLTTKHFTKRQEKNIINTCTDNWLFNKFIEDELAKRAPHS